MEKKIPLLCPLPFCMHGKIIYYGRPMRVLTTGVTTHRDSVLVLGPVCDRVLRVNVVRLCVRERGGCMVHHFFPAVQWVPVDLALLSVR